MSSFSSSNFAEILIAEVYKRRTLWDTSQKTYHNRYIADVQWTEVANAVGSTKVLAKAKWKSLRDAFRRELKRNPKFSFGDAATVLRSKWSHFDSLLFLKDVITQRESSSNIGYMDSTKVQDDDVQSECDMSEGEGSSSSLVFDGHLDIVKSERLSPVCHFFVNDIRTPSPPPSPPPALTPPVATPPPLSPTPPPKQGQVQELKRKRKERTTFEEQLLQLEVQKLKMLDSQPECEDTKFLMSLVPYMRKLDQLDKLDVMGKTVALIKTKLENKK